MADPREVARPFAPPDHTDPAERGAMRAAPPLAVGDRVAWVNRTFVATPGRRKRVERTVDLLGTVAEVVDDGWLYVDLDRPAIVDEVSATRVLLPARLVFPRPGR